MTSLWFRVGVLDGATPGGVSLLFHARSADAPKTVKVRAAGDKLWQTAGTAPRGAGWFTVTIPASLAGRLFSAKRPALELLTGFAIGSRGSLQFAPYLFVE